MSNLQSLEQRMDRVDYQVISDDKDKIIADIEAKLAEQQECGLKASAKHNLEMQNAQICIKELEVKLAERHKDKIKFAIAELRNVRKFADGRTYLAHYINNRVDELRKQLTHQHEDKGE